MMPSAQKRNGMWQTCPDRFSVWFVDASGFVCEFRCARAERLEQGFCRTICLSHQSVDSNQNSTSWLRRFSSVVIRFQHWSELIAWLDHATGLLTQDRPDPGFNRILLFCAFMQMSPGANRNRVNLRGRRVDEGFPISSRSPSSFRRRTNKRRRCSPRESDQARSPKFW